MPFINYCGVLLNKSNCSGLLSTGVSVPGNKRQEDIIKKVNNIRKAIITQTALINHEFKTVADINKIKLPVGMSMNARALKAAGVLIVTSETSIL
jgi:hypothetical protein